VWHHAHLRAGASIGGNATLVGGIEIGAWAMVGAGAVVTRSVGAHELVVGNPARRHGWVCRCGATRVREGEATVLRCDRCGMQLDDLG
jgi:UDP-2-acetamido-3-amino-2,3-dideoxy-glucuronate N-acetyltransferase